MAIEINNSDHRQRLQKALRRAYSDAYTEREVRRNLIRIYEDAEDMVNQFNMEDEYRDLGTLLNLFQKYVKGHLLSLAHYMPRWSINARRKSAKGLDKRIQNFLNAYCPVIDFNTVQSQLALDSAFGWAVAYVDNGLPPKGITAPVSPRVYRIDPDCLIVDRTAATFKECSYIGHVFMVPLNEAKSYENFNPEEAAKISEFRFSTGQGTNPDIANEEEMYAEPMCRLINVYIPKTGKVYTWDAPTDEFHQVTQPPLGERDVSINPYCVLSLLNKPGQVKQLARLASLRGLHLLANEMLNKGVDQARASQRNPVAPLGSEQDLETALAAGDNNPIYLEKKELLGLYTIPGPDQSILSLGQFAAGLFSSEAGNLEVALGASTGADTAKQTEALIGQISASQSIDRRSFELFLCEIGKKVSTLAFKNEALKLETLVRIPGTKLTVAQQWPPVENIENVVAIDDFNFDVAQFSTAFRTPQERLGQLNQASQLIMQWMQVKASGAPINLEAIIESCSESFDLVPELAEWWTGEPPEPPEQQVRDTYTSLAKASEGSDVRYQGKQGGGQQAAASPALQDQGGVQ